MAAEDKDTAADAGTAGGGKGKGKGSKGDMVLLVEDVRVSQKVAQKNLEKMGYRVDVADTGEAAVTKFKKSADQLKLVLMDIGVRLRPVCFSFKMCVRAASWHFWHRGSAADSRVRG